MEREMIASRLLKLRTEKGVSAREMSLAIGQNAGYINSIETSKAMPSMSLFLCICDYLELQPYEFFDVSSDDPIELRNIYKNLKKLDSRQLRLVSALIRGLLSDEQ